MTARVLSILGAAVAVVAAVGWLELAPSSTPHPPATTDHPVDLPNDPVAAPTLPPVMPEPVAAPANQAAPALAARTPPADSSAADERTVLGMYQNMADAVDAYGPDACPALGQAFGAFVADGAAATSRLVRASKAKGQDFTASFTAAHGPEVERVKTKLQEAIKRCGTDPGVRQALTALAKSA